MIEMSLKEKLLNAMKIRGVKVPKLSKETGIPADRIYKWFQQGTHPKEEDSVILEKWINGESENVENNAPVSDSKAFYGHDSGEASLSGLIEINRNLSAAAMIDAESRKELVRQNEYLTKMLQEERTNSAGRKENELRQLEASSQILVQIAQIGVKAGFYRSLEQAADILSIPLENLAKSVMGKKQASRNVGKA